MCETIRPVRPEDLDAVTALENACFPPAEAATREAFAYRIAAYPERFFVAEQGGQIIGLINGCASDADTIDDALFTPGGHVPDGKNQMILGLAVDPACRGRGTAGRLLRHLCRFAQSRSMENVILTCKQELISFYAQFGFQNRGVSASVHGGAVWYDMVLPLKKWEASASH